MNLESHDNSKKANSKAPIAIVASFTADPLLPALNVVLQQAGLALNVRFAPYNQIFQELLSPTSLLSTNTGGVDVVLVRMEDFVREVEDTEEALRYNRAHCQRTRGCAGLSFLTGG